MHAFMRRSRSMAVVGTTPSFGERGLFSMCNQHHWNEHDKFGFLVDAPAIRRLIDEVDRHAEIGDAAERIERLKPAFATLLASDG